MGELSSMRNDKVSNNVIQMIKLMMLSFKKEGLKSYSFKETSFQILLWHLLSKKKIRWILLQKIVEFPCRFPSGVVELLKFRK